MIFYFLVEVCFYIKRQNLKIYSWQSYRNIWLKWRWLLFLFKQKPKNKRKILQDWSLIVADILHFGSLALKKDWFHFQLLLLLLFSRLSISVDYYFHSVVYYAADQCTFQPQSSKVFSKKLYISSHKNVVWKSFLIFFNYNCRTLLKKVFLTFQESNIQNPSAMILFLYFRKGY